MSLPPLAVTGVGSWPRSKALLQAQKRKRAGKLSPAEFDAQADQAVLEILALQDEAGVDVVTDGEQRRDNFYSFVADKLNGVKLMTLAEMLEVIEDKVGFERILQTLDVPAYSISNPSCVGKISRREPLAAAEARFLRKHSKKAIKIPLPGPYLLTRAMFVKEVSRGAYATKEDLAEDVVRVLGEEVEELAGMGVDFIQLDEPVLTELVFTQGQTRTFMCAALAATKDPTQELELAVRLINRVAERAKGARVGLHICRGNWSQNEETLLRGSYAPLKPYLDRLGVQQLVLEYATERAGDIMKFQPKELGLGVVNPRTESIETVDEVKAEIRRALELYPASAVFLNPDCGFGTFSNRPVNSQQIALEKMRVIARAAKELRA